MRKHNYVDGSIIKNRFFISIKYIILTTYSLTTLYPLFWVFISSLKDNDEIYSRPFFTPMVWRFKNYADVWVSANIGLDFFNSLFYSFTSVIIIVLVSSMAAYAIARVRPKTILYTYFTLGIMIPVHAVIIPLFISIRTLGLLNTRPGLILAYVVGNLSFSIFVLVGFMRGLPRDVEESAMIDGCSRTRTFFSIVLPIAKPGLATIATFAFLACWNDFLLALLLAVSPELKTLNLACFSLRGLYTVNYGQMSAALVLLIVPVSIIYILFQEQVIKGMTAGAVKG